MTALLYVVISSFGVFFGVKGMTIESRGLLAMESKGLLHEVLSQRRGYGFTEVIGMRERANRVGLDTTDTWKTSLLFDLVDSKMEKLSAYLRKSVEAVQKELQKQLPTEPPTEPPTKLPTELPTEVNNTNKTNKTSNTIKANQTSQPPQPSQAPQTTQPPQQSKAPLNMATHAEEHSTWFGPVLNKLRTCGANVTRRHVQKRPSDQDRPTDRKNVSNVSNQSNGTNLTRDETTTPTNHTVDDLVYDTPVYWHRYATPEFRDTFGFGDVLPDDPEESVDDTCRDVQKEKLADMTTKCAEFQKHMNDMQPPRCICAPNFPVGEKDTGVECLTAYEQWTETIQPTLLSLSLYESQCENATAAHMKAKDTCDGY